MAQRSRIILQPDAVSAPLFTILRESSNNIVFGLQLIDSVKELISPFEVQSENTFFIYGIDVKQEQDISLSKENFKLWILRKGFEDLVKGINESLVNAYVFVSIVAKAKERKTINAVMELEELQKEASKMHIPILLNKIKPHLSGALAHENDILSINKVRNCLVHRNGIVTEKDITDNEKKQLKFEFTRMALYSVENGVEIEATKPFAFADDIVLRTDVKDSIEFNLGDRINFSFQQFNSVMSNCNLFAIDLVQKLPLKL